MNIGVVCATLASRNTGMLTVDLAAYDLCRRLRPEAKTTLYYLGSSEHCGYGPSELPFSYLPLQDNFDRLLASDLIVFWGDFHHSRGYWHPGLSRRLIKQGVAPSPESAESLFYRHLAMEDVPEEVLRKVIVFGGSLLANSTRDWMDRRYVASVERLFRHAGAVFLRDALSASFVSTLRPNTATLGIDCALMLNDTGIVSLGEPTSSFDRIPPQLGIFFGRCGLKQTVANLGFALNVARQLGYAPVWIPWLMSGDRRQRLMAGLYGLHVPGNAVRPPDILAQLGACQAVVTDTYHLSVNAWRMGVPAACIGRGTEARFDPLTDKKKEILFSMYRASDYYVFAETLDLFGSRRQAVRIASQLSDKNAADTVQQDIRRHQVVAHDRLTSAVNAITGGH